MNTPRIDRDLTKHKKHLIMLKSSALILASIALTAVSTANRTLTITGTDNLP